MEIFNDYHKMYAKYLQLYKKFSKAGKIKTLTKKQYQLIIKLLVADTTDTDDTQVCEGLLAFIEMMFGSKLLATNYLKDLRQHSSNKKLNKKLDDLLLLAQMQVQNDKPNKIYYNGVNFAFAKGFTKLQMMVAARKYGNYADYAINKAIDVNYKPKDPKTIATGQFETSSREQLVDMFDSKNFYNLSDKQKAQLFQSVVNDYCTSNGVKPCAIKVDELPVGDKSVCYGEYIPSEATIVLNKTVLDSISFAKETDNAFLPLQILSTLIHESQHRVQFETADGPYNSPRQMMVSNNLKNPQMSLSYKEYLSEPDELDARGAALKYIKDVAQRVDNPNLNSFYDTKLIAEIKNNKVDVPDHIKSMFPDIYNSSAHTNGGSMRNEQADYIKMLKSIQMGE